MQNFAEPSVIDLPRRFADWFSQRGWSPRAHQLELLRVAQEGQSALLIAATGAGKTLAGFLPSLVELESPKNRRSLHTLYISPLKALAVDVERNLQSPVRDMGLTIKIETRTGDTSQSKRQRQRRDPPDILLTTPEQLALLLANPDANYLFASLRRIIFDELHAIANSKRGDLLSLGLARLRSLAPQMTTIGLSATVRDPDELRRWLVSQGKEPNLAALILAPQGAPVDLTILETEQVLPWAGHSAAHALSEVYAKIKAARMSLVFVNTRAQAEFVFQELWRRNEDHLPIALHHGSLDVGQRRRVEEAMSQGRLKAVVCTSTLDLGIDWGDVDLVVNIGAPKGSSRLMQRIGRSNHRFDEPSRAVLVPSNHFEVLECVAAVEAARENAQDTAIARAGALDVLCQHILGTACAAPFGADDLYREVISAEPYRSLDRQTFEDCLSFVATGGYALKAYERFAKIKPTKDNLWRVSNARVAQIYRMNLGTIVEAEMLKVRLIRGGFLPSSSYTGLLRRSGRLLGEIEAYFLENLSPKDTFLFGGEILALQSIVEDQALVARADAKTPKIPSYAGGKFPLSTYLAAGVRKLLADPAHWTLLPDQVVEWLKLQKRFSALPPADALLVETFPRGDLFYLSCYPFEGRLAHQTLGMLLTRRLDRAHLQPLGFAANDYALCIWCRLDMSAAVREKQISLEALFSEDMLGDDLEEWLQESALMKRTFRNCAIIAGLIERNFPGGKDGGMKRSRELRISTDLIYDVLRKAEPDHILLRAARSDAATGLLDIERLGGMLARIKKTPKKILHRPLTRVSPLSVPIMLEIGRESIYGEAQDAILAEAAEGLMREAVAHKNSSLAKRS